VSVQAQVLNTLRRLKSELGLSFLFITHDLNVIKFVSDRLGILYYGKLLEVGETYDVVTNPKHPYTTKLIGNVPSLKRVENRESAPDKGPSTVGCVYSQVCPYAFEKCVEVPYTYAVGSEHYASCFLYERGPKEAVNRIT
jgi:oligopeptide/dipeptide ABC transporter ATP-binding protein